MTAFQETVETFAERIDEKFSNIEKASRISEIEKVEKVEDSGIEDSEQSGKLKRSVIVASVMGVAAFFGFEVLLSHLVDAYFSIDPQNCVPASANGETFRAASCAPFYNDTISLPLLSTILFSPALVALTQGFKNLRSKKFLVKAAVPLVALAVSTGVINHSVDEKLTETEIQASVPVFQKWASETQGLTFTDEEARDALTMRDVNNDSTHIMSTVKISKNGDSKLTVGKN